MHNKNHHKNKTIELVSGADYDNPSGWQELYAMIEQQVQKSYGNNYDAQWLNWMIRLDQQRNGFTTGVRSTETGKLLCLLVAEWQFNMWVDRRECNIVGILTTPRCAPRYIDLMLNQLNWWAKEQQCHSINIFTWDARKAYQRWCESKGFNLHQYTYTKEVQ